MAMSLQSIFRWFTLQRRRISLGPRVCIWARNLRLDTTTPPAPPVNLPLTNYTTLQMNLVNASKHNRTPIIPLQGCCDIAPLLERAVAVQEACLEYLDSVDLRIPMEQIGGFTPEGGFLFFPNPTAASTPAPSSEVVMHVEPRPRPGSLVRGESMPSPPPVASKTRASPAVSPWTSPPTNTPDEKPPPSRRNQAANSRCRKRRVAAASNPMASLGLEPMPPPLSKYPVSTLPVQIDAEGFNVSGGGSYIGDQGYKGRSTPWSVAELLELGFTYVEWDGATRRAILDSEKRVIGALAGRPQGNGWDDAVADAQRALEGIRKEGEASDCLKKGELNHWRGGFLALPVGISFSGGQKKPGNLAQHPKLQTVIDNALASTGLQRVAGFQNKAFFSFAPNIFRDIQANMLALHTSHPGLQRNFPKSIYPAASLNCGPNTTCLQHLDFANAPHSLCAITSLGRFNPKTGGHLVLFDLKLIVKFPPGSTILIPSGTVGHGNTPIQLGEERCSVTQYCSGGLLRWVKYGCKPVGSVGKAAREKIDGQPGHQWLEKLALFSKFSDLAKDYTVRSAD